MNHQEFLVIFKKHLRVAEPKRTSLLEEMKTHLDELPKDLDAVTTLGYPMDLARKYNRTHIGLLGSKTLLFGLPTIVTLFLFLFSWNGALSGMIQYASNRYEVFSFLIYVPIIFFILCASWCGVALRRTHFSTLSFGGLIMSALASPTVLLTLIEYIVWMHDPGRGYLGGIFGQGQMDPPAGYPFAWAWNLQQNFAVAMMGTILATMFIGFFAIITEPLFRFSGVKNIIVRKK